jgi:hypothetical protein
MNLHTNLYNEDIQMQHQGHLQESAKSLWNLQNAIGNLSKNPQVDP